MENPLSLEERLSVMGLYDHDAAGHYAKIGAVLLEDMQISKEDVCFSYYIVGDILESVNRCRGDRICLDTVTPDYLRISLGELTHISKKPNQVAYSMGLGRDLKSKACLIQTALHSLVDNSLKVNGNEGRVNITVSEFSGEVANPLYVPERAEIDGNFIRFCVQDNGPGFPEGRPLKDYLNLGVTTRERSDGFGLYYVSLVCKVLRCPLTIESMPGNTEISFYHPTNLE